MNSQKNQLKKEHKNKRYANVALIGYTNTGKSAILNTFSKQEVVES